MGLIGGMARTAVVAGTATAVSNRVSRRQARRWQGQENAQQAQYAQDPQYGYGQPAQYEQQPQYGQPAQYAAPPPQPSQPSDAGGQDSLTAELQRLAGLKSQGFISDAEFAAAKAKLLGI